MYEEKRFLSAKEILDKDFKIDPKGYRPQEVDAFLDLIIKDYVDFENTTKRLVSEIKTLERMKIIRDLRLGTYDVLS